MTVAVLFVCLGNICRSPTADAVFAHKARALGLHRRVHVDSAGTGDWHIGQAPDVRAQRHAARRGYDLSVLRARQVVPEDFRRFDFVLAMDRGNLADLQRLRPGPDGTEPQLLLGYGSSGLLEVPDPYYGGDEGFEQVLDLIEDAADALLAHIRATRL
ncbi:MAG: Low molecular weight protein-tyrosine-phosphatase YfkJ [Pseudomonadales bacterium]|nr:Low molecular weight protein-tyrosine-phosphatase YfkJ [Pseudomonadales bacterium]